MTLKSVIIHPFATLFHFYHLRWDDDNDDDGDDGDGDDDDNETLTTKITTTHILFW
jgi:hypothetical protein